MKINDITVPDSATYLELIKDTPLKEGALGVTVRGDTLPLNSPYRPEGDARILTYADEEGRRIYERTLQLMFLVGLRQIAPQAKARFEHSFGNGIYVRISGEEVTEEFTGRLKAAMAGLAEADIPISYNRYDKSQAEEYYSAENQMDKLRILRYRNFRYFDMYELKGIREYFYGVMCPSTGYVNVFDLAPYPPGIVLLMPSIEDASRPAAFKSMPKLMDAYKLAARENEMMGCTNAADLNEFIQKRRFRELIRMCEAMQERKIQSIADSFIESGAKILLIAGPSSSGKTTFSHRMNIALKVRGLNPVSISLDNYYLDREKIPVGPDGTRDFERIDTLDIELLCKQLLILIEGGEVELPEFDFKTGKRIGSTVGLRVGRDQPIIIEGIHALNEELTRSVPRSLKFKVYISALNLINLDDHCRIRTTDARLLRRIVRDSQFRGTSPEETMAMWDKVRYGEDNYIFPYQEEADVIFNSSLTYELPVLKKYVYMALATIDRDSPYYTLARRQMKFLNYFMTTNAEDEIPPNSLLREFIGGCGFYKAED